MSMNSERRQSASRPSSARVPFCTVLGPVYRHSTLQYASVRKGLQIRPFFVRCWQQRTSLLFGGLGHSGCQPLCPRFESLSGSLSFCRELPRPLGLRRTPRGRPPGVSFCAGPNACASSPPFARDKKTPRRSIHKGSWQYIRSRCSGGSPSISTRSLILQSEWFQTTS